MQFTNTLAYFFINRHSGLLLLSATTKSFIILTVEFNAAITIVILQFVTLITTSHFHLSRIFVSKAEAYQSGVLYMTQSRDRFLSTLANIGQGWKWLSAVLITNAVKVL